MRTSLVTGGAGFIGSHLVRGLLARGDAVRVLDNFSTGRIENLSQLDGSLEIIEADLRDDSKVAHAVRGVDYIFHQAAFVSVPQSMQEPGTCFAVNVSGTLNLLEAARKAGVKQVVLASSAAVYGESRALPLKENATLGVLSPYAASKQVNEIYAGLYTRGFGLPVVALRYFNVFGPRQSPESDYAAAIPIFIRRLLDGRAPTIFGDGEQSRDFIFVGDVVRANLLAAENPQAAGGVFNICTGQEISILDLVNTLSKIIPGAPPPKLGPPRPGDIYRSLGDPGQAAEVLEFRPEVSLSEGLTQTVEWMQS
ncbi:MAG TPA: SDR family oxidoreductase [Anaerolineales bacterium]|jgi:UDP-glucose 4-epimerase|nr:SDR family oxidoreductase [Anaerolineales bacterium]